MFPSRDDSRGSKRDHSDQSRSQDDDSSRYGSGSDSYSTGSSRTTPPGKTTYDTYSSSYGSGRNDYDRDAYGSDRKADNEYSTSDSYGSGRVDNDSNVSGHAYGSTANPREYSSGSRNDSNSTSGAYGTRTTGRSDDDYSGSSSYISRRDGQDTYNSRSSTKTNDENEDKSFMSSMMDKAKDMVGKGHDQGRRDYNDDDDNDRNKRGTYKEYGDDYDSDRNKHGDKKENKSFTATLFGE